MTITQAFLTSEISNLWPDNTTGAITPANARTTLNDMVTAIFQGISPTALSTSNTWTALQTFSGGVVVPIQSVGDNTTIMGGFFGVGQNIVLNFGGSSTQGGREAFQATAALVTTTSASSGNRNYVGIQGVGTSIANDNGTSPASAATASGAVFGGG